MGTQQKHLPRLDRGYYRGQAYVHWILNIEDRRTGWMTGAFYYKLRELLTHAAFRYSFVCPIFCLMPDHIHMLWIGIDDKSDQHNAMKFFRKHVSDVLTRIDFALQHQPFDHVLRDDERLENAVEQLVDYIARNPERKNLAPIDGFAEYKFTGCLVPGYPELMLWDNDFWLRFWRCCSYLGKNGLSRPYDENVSTG